MIEVAIIIIIIITLIEDNLFIVLLNRLALAAHHCTHRQLAA